MSTTPPATTIYETTKEPIPSAGAYVGYNVVVQIAEESIAKAQRVSFNINNNIRQFYVVSSRSPLNVETSFIIRGTIRHLYFNTALLRLVIGRDQVVVGPHGASLSATDWAGMLGSGELVGGTPSFATADDFFRLPEVTIACVLKREDSAQTSTQTITLNGVKFDTWDFTIDANDVVLENATFFAESISVSLADGIATG